MAIAQGLVTKILGHAASEQERLDFFADCKAAAGDEETFQQEYMCVPVDEASAWLTWDLITSAEHADAGVPALYQGGDCYIGVDIGRRHDFFVIWVDEKVGDVYWTREVIKLKNASFAEQDAALDRVFDYYKVRRACIDQTGIGEKPVEDAKIRHGNYKVEGILFTGPVKQHLATIIKQQFEDKKPARQSIKPFAKATMRFVSSPPLLVTHALMLIVPKLAMPMNFGRMRWRYTQRKT